MAIVVIFTAKSDLANVSSSVRKWIQRSWDMGSYYGIAVGCHPVCPDDLVWHAQAAGVE